MFTLGKNNNIRLHSFFLLRKYPYLAEGRKYSSYPKLYLLSNYLLLALAANYFCIFMKGHGGDMGYWRSWAESLATTGYRGFDGNYPPIYVHWLYLVGKVLHFMGQPVEDNNLFKLLSQIPVVFSHLVLTRIVFSILVHRAMSGPKLHALMLLTVLNPALLWAGPAWGQVDIVPVTFIVCALYLLLMNALTFLVLPLFTIALLTKFQMICFAPMFAIIFWRDFRNTLIGGALSLLVAGVIFLPFAVTGGVENIIRQAYIDTLGQYPYTTYNAGNIWMILTGNTWPDSHIFFGFEPGSVLGYLFTAKYLGMFAFFLASVGVLLNGLRHQLRNSTTDFTFDESARHVFYALFCATAFFVLLPGMHERYVLPAAVVSLVYAAVHPSRILYALVLTFAGFLNVALVYGINGSDIWLAASWVAVSTFAVLLVEMAGSSNIAVILRERLFRLTRMRYAMSAAFPLSLVMAVFVLDRVNQIQQPELTENQMLLTELVPRKVHQSYGDLKVHRNLEDKLLSLDGQRYAYGLGTHANSYIEYSLPENVASLSFTAGIDDVAGGGEVRFSVYGDDRKLWESGVLRRALRSTATAEVTLHGVRKLTLKVDSLGNTSHDHANWANPILTLNDDA